MPDIREDSSLVFLIIVVRVGYLFMIGWFGRGFWLAGPAFYSPPIGVIVVAWVGLLSMVAMLGILGILLFAKNPNRTFARLYVWCSRFFVRRVEQ